MRQEKHFYSRMNGTFSCSTRTDFNFVTLLLLLTRLRVESAVQSQRQIIKVIANQVENLGLFETAALKLTKTFDFSFPQMHNFNEKVMDASNYTEPYIVFKASQLFNGATRPSSHHHRCCSTEGE